MNGDVQSDLSTMDNKNAEQLQYLYSRILRLQQELNLYKENVSPTRILFQNTKALSKSNKIKDFIFPKMTDLITFLDNNKKLDIYTGYNINELYYYTEMMGYPTNLTFSGQQSHNFGTPCSTNNDIAHF